MANDGRGSDFWTSILKREPPAMEVRAIGAALALSSEGRFLELEDLYRAARGLGIARDPLVEGALSAHLFSGFPRAIEAFFALCAVFEGPPATVDRRETVVAKNDGERLFAAIYGKNEASVRDQLERFAPDFARAVLEDAYARILSRPGLTGTTRELAAVCALASCGLDRQLFSHVRGAVALGATASDVTAMVELAGRISPDTAARSREVLKRALPPPT